MLAMLAASVRLRADRANSYESKPLICRENGTGANRRERLRQLDKLGVTGWSPVPPIQGHGGGGFRITMRGDWCDTCPLCDSVLSPVLSPGPWPKTAT